MINRQTPRAAVCWLPDWPVTAVGASPDTLCAVVDGLGPRAVVIACSAAARAAGIRRGQRARDAHRISPLLTVHPRDEAGEARAFEPVLAALESLVAGLEIVRPGLVAFDLRGPARYHGGEEPLARCVRDAVGALSDAAGDSLGCGVGMADGQFAAFQASRSDLIIEPGGSAAFLAPMPLRVLERPALASALIRLGITTLGAFAALPGAAVANRFGTEGIEAHRLARGLDPRPPAARRPSEDLAQFHEFDPPAETDEAVVFVAKMLAERLYNALGAAGVACARLGIEARTASGRHCARRWRLGELTAGRLPPAGVAMRCSWQIGSWRTREPYPSADPVVALRLVPDQLVIDTGAQQALWGAEQIPNRVAQAAERVQDLLGLDALVRAQLTGGRDPAARVRWVPFGELPDPGPDAAAPWPGTLPPPSPPLVPDEPVDAELRDAAGREVEVTGRARLSAAPALLVVGRDRLAVTGWAGPWAYDERAWDPGARRRQARVQCSTSDGRAWLLTRRDGHWRIEGLYQ